MIKKKFFTSDTFVYFVSLTFILVCFSVCVLCYQPPFFLQEQKEMARIGDIEIGSDSITAIQSIKKRAEYVVKNGDSIIIDYGDSIGYTYVPCGEKYYVKLDSGYVSEIYFQSDVLNEKDVKILRKNVKYKKHHLIYHRGERFTITFDGVNTYRVFKNK